MTDLAARYRWLSTDPSQSLPAHAGIIISRVWRHRKRVCYGRGVGRISLAGALCTFLGGRWFNVSMLGS